MDLVHFLLTLFCCISAILATNDNVNDLNRIGQKLLSLKKELSKIETPIFKILEADIKSKEGDWKHYSSTCDMSQTDGTIKTIHKNLEVIKQNFNDGLAKIGGKLAEMEEQSKDLTGISADLDQKKETIEMEKQKHQKSSIKKPDFEPMMKGIHQLLDKTALQRDLVIKLKENVITELDVLVRNFDDIYPQYGTSIRNLIHAERRLRDEKLIVRLPDIGIEFAKHLATSIGTKMDKEREIEEKLDELKKVLNLATLKTDLVELDQKTMTVLKSFRRAYSSVVFSMGNTSDFDEYKKDNRKNEQKMKKYKTIITQIVTQIGSALLIYEQIAEKRSKVWMQKNPRPATELLIPQINHSSHGADAENKF